MLPMWDPLGPGSAEVVRQAGRHLVSRDAPRDRVSGRLKTLGGSPEPCPDGDGRRTVLVLLWSSPVGGLENRLGVLLTELADEHRFVVAVMGRPGPLGSARMAALCRLTPHVYPVGPWFEPELWPSLVAHLVARFAVSSVLAVGSGPGTEALVGSLKERFPDLWFVHQHEPGSADAEDLRPGPGIDLHLAVTAAAEQGLRSQGCAPDQVLAIAPEVVAGAVVTGDPGSLDRGQLRPRLGLPEAATAVVMVSDLLPEKRPEDFVALARRLCDDKELFFVLVGEGPLAATVRDMARIFDLPRFALRPPDLPLSEVVAAADVVCSTSEAEPHPAWLLAAMAAGRTVVACGVDDVASLLERYGDDRSTAVPVADLEAMERTLRTVAAGPATADVVAQIAAARERALALWRQALATRPGS
jgi:glycosyltransferase involved in cell wall biosynthesis